MCKLIYECWDCLSRHAVTIADIVWVCVCLRGQAWLHLIDKVMLGEVQAWVRLTSGHHLQYIYFQRDVEQFPVMQ